MKISYFFWMVVLFAFIVRVFLAFFSLQYRENTDILRYRDWARTAYLHSLADTYTQKYLTFGTLPNNQPPGSLYILSAFYNVNILFAKVVLRVTSHTPEVYAWLSGQALNFMLRLPSIIADCLIGVGVWFYFGKPKFRTYRVLATLIILFNPVFIFNSAIWGQMDSIVVLFFLLSVYFLEKKRMLWSMVCLTMSLFVKVFSIYTLPLFSILWWKLEKNKTTLLLGIMTSFLLSIGLVLPVSLQPLGWMYWYVTHSLIGEMTNITIFAMNFWWMLFRPFVTIGDPGDMFSFSSVHLNSAPLSSVTIYGVSLFTIAIIIFISFAVVLCFPLIRSKIVSSKELWKTFSLIALSAFLFLPQMHERYIYLALVLLGISVGFDRKLLPYYLLLSFCNMVNVYIVWHPMRLSFFPYEIWTNAQFQWAISIVTVITSMTLFFQSIHENYRKI
ncbi:hypothetical protein A2Z00_02590 [Candidatus Gottesmanbacteria bacterium RBG_13_45_10]|uniref:Glycosyltransferase RgtA/B/C/D-like domain-containing protein n=1 Tax=Candidatus Gottesmanbacteria bacterium RBG_13_45_10 TaxID=1798370 RepID=A0A1F5ZFQ9_9BACT|nr:MAG: hypothetical protein A2Z00_02590 [Candidatus Gottesmanbacteria bacterium RBG_13_45_10]